MIDFADRFMHLYQLNQQILDSVREGRWHQCIALVESYTSQLNGLMADIPDIRDSDTSEALRHLAAPLFACKQEIENHIAKQRIFIKENMLMLQRGRLASRHYTRQEIAQYSDR